MIAKICGKITEKGNHHILLDVGGISYQVLIPPAVMQRLDESVAADGLVQLITYHYHHLEPSRSTPVLIGFLNEIEKEFFEVFITVSGIGPRAALRALDKPISEIARAIDEADIEFLKSLPGIGQQRAREIVAKLQNKVGKFGLIKDDSLRARQAQHKDIAEEAVAVLMQLEYKRPEATSMIKKALERCGQALTTEELLNEVYRQRRAR
ncbi:MAG TPA: Holliday junction branch migration protein RuvA [Patescibacteria group bacterium]|nr:Holliday junction branch migration protein RuvA [Patescibacteria group bacterium]